MFKRFLFVFLGLIALQTAASAQRSGFVGGGINFSIPYGTFYFGLNTQVGSDDLLGRDFGGRATLDFLFTPQLIIGLGFDMYADISTGSIVHIHAGGGIDFKLLLSGGTNFYLIPHALVGIDVTPIKALSIFFDLEPGPVIGLSGDGVGFNLDIKFGVKYRF